MKGIYLTEQGKKELEAKIAELEKEKASNLIQNLTGFANMNFGEIETYKEILSSAIILPVYSSWEDVETFPPDNESQAEKILKIKNGVVIQSV